MKRIMKYTAVILATLGALLILWQFNLVILLFVLSLFMAAAIRPFVDWLTNRGVPKAVAQLLLYLIGVSIFVLLILLLSEPFLLEINLGVNRAVISYENLYRNWQEGASWQVTISQALPPPFNINTAQESGLENMLPAVVSVTQGIVTALGGLLLVLALSVYWSVDQNRFERLWLSLLPAKQRTYARNSWREIELNVGSYLRSQLSQSVLAALFLGIGAAVAGLTFPILLAVLGALAAFIPLFGGLIAAVIAFILGSIESRWTGVGMAIYTLILFWGLDRFIEPRFLVRERRNFLLIIILIVPLLELFGIWGLLIAPPLATAIEVLIVQTYKLHVEGRDTTVQLDDLEARFQKLSGEVSQAENDAVTPELQNILQRLDALLADSRTI